MDNGHLLPSEDYLEPRCPLCMSPRRENVMTVPQARILAKLDEYLEKEDNQAAERHLLYWLDEANLGHDEGGSYLIRNELMGLYRKNGNEAAALEQARLVLEAIPFLGYENNVSGATGKINAATVFCAFGRPEQAVPLFEEARAIYGHLLPDDDARIGALNNNLGLALVPLGRYGEAYEAYQRALAVMNAQPDGQLEAAITHLNIADAAVAEHGPEKAEAKVDFELETARKLLDTPSLPRNGYYAFVAGKCAEVYDYYGYFLVAAELRKRAEAIHAGA